MKIWFQSSTPLGYDPKYDDYRDTLVSYLNKVARPGNEVSVHGCKLMSPYYVASRYEMLLHDYQIIENLLQAQQEGYDAFCMTCMFDPAFDALREVADIPVCSSAETSMLLASFLSPNFSLLSYNKMVTMRMIELVKRYGLQDRFIETSTLHIEQEEEAFYRAFDNPRVILEPAKELAREATKRGVCLFVNTDGRLNMIMAKHNIRQIEGIPVLEGGGAMLKMAELLVDLKNMGVERSKLGLYTPIAKEDLASMRKLYGL